MTIISFSTFAASAYLLSTASCNPLQKRDPPGFAVMEDYDFPDPSILLVDNQWYAYATGSNGPHAQLARSSTFESGWAAVVDNNGPKDAMPTLASWVTADDVQGGSQIFAPDVVNMGGGNYVMYYSGRVSTAYAPPGTKDPTHCIGAATSTSPEGPFAPVGNDPFACPYDQGGAIDPAGFKDDDGTLWMVYKIDGNNLGSSGTCNNGDGHPTPIMAQKLMTDGTTPDGDPFQILDRAPGSPEDSADGAYIEAPSLIKKDGTYYLFFSSGCYCDNTYDTSYATQTVLAPDNMFNKVQAPDAPLIVAQDGAMNAPGGADVNLHGNKIAWHYTVSGSCATNDLKRGMRVGDITTGNGVVHF